MPFVLTDNEFFTGLTNLALFMRLYATNTSHIPQSFVDSFATDTLANGNKKIFPFADLPAVGDYAEASSLLTVTKVDTNEETIAITEKKIIKSSYSAYILEMAFTSDSGMNEFVGYVMGQMESAKTNYIYNQIITDLFAKVFAGANQNVDVDQYTLDGLVNLADINAGEIMNQKKIALAVQNNLNNIQVYSTGYNGKGYTQALDTKDMKFLFCNPYHNENVINLFASLLKSDVIANSFEKPEEYVIPDIKIPADKTAVIGWLMHKYAYQFFYKFVFMGTFFDPSNLVINNFLHFWFGKGWLDNLPVVKFTAKAIV